MQNFYGGAFKKASGLSASYIVVRLQIAPFEYTPGIFKWGFLDHL